MFVYIVAVCLLVCMFDYVATCVAAILHKINIGWQF